MGLLGAVAVTAAALALAGGTHASPRAVDFGTEASNKRLAEVGAERELRSVAVPPGARRVAEAPAPSLEEPLGTSGDPNEIDRRKWLVAPGTVGDTMRWFRAHPPSHSHIELTATGGGGQQSIWFAVPEHSRRVRGPSVIEAVAKLAGRRVGILVEVRQDWKTPHPAAAKVPAEARFLAVSRSIGGGRPKWQLIRSPRRVRRIAHAIDQLPVPEDVISYGCGVVASTVRRVSVRLLFRAHKGGPVLAEASQRVPREVCESMLFTVRGDPRTFALDDGERALALLHH
jgi:hypothetical protein